MGEYDDLIKQLTEAGASDEEIMGIINEQISKKKPAPQANPVPTTIGEGISNAFNRGEATAQIADVLNPHEADMPTDEGFAQVQQAVQTQQANPGSQEYQDFSNAQGFGEGIQAFAKAPIQILSELTTESLVPLFEHGAARIGVAGAAGAALGAPVLGVGAIPGAATGAVVGAGATSLNLEYSSSIIESLQEAGVDFNSMDSIKEAFKNKELMDEARNHALLKGVPIAAFDMASGGIAGSIFKKPAKSILKKAAQGAAELGVQMAMGAGGEVAGELASGEKLQPGAILAEALGELGTTPIEVATGSLRYAKNTIGDAIKDNRGVIKDAAKIAGQDPTTTIGDGTDDDIDMAYADIAAEYDKVETELRDMKDVEREFADTANKAAYHTELDSYLDNLSWDVLNPNRPAQEESEIPQDNLTPEDAARVQGGAMLDPNTQETLLDDSEQASPAYDNRVQEFTPSINDENEIPDNTATFTPSEAGAIQASTLPTQPTQEINDAADQSFESPVEQPTIPENTKPVPAPKPVLESKPKVESKPVVDTKAIEAEKIAAQREKEATAKEKQKIKISKFVESAKKLKPAKRLARLKELDELTLDDPELNKPIAKALEKFQAVEDEKEFKRSMKEETVDTKLDVISARNQSPEVESAIEDLRAAKGKISTDLETTESAYTDFKDAASKLQGKGMLSVEQAELKNIIDEGTKEFEKALEPKRKAEAEANKSTADKKTKQNNERDKHLTKIAKSIERDTPAQRDLDIDTYMQWRRDQGLQELSKQDIIKKASAEFYINRAKNQIKEEGTKARTDARKSSEDAKKAANKDIAREFGLSDDSIVSEMTGFEDVDADQGIINSFSNVEKITPDQLFQRIENMYGNYKQYTESLRKLFDIVSKVSKKFSDTGLEIYIGNHTKGGTRGFHVFDPTSERELLFVSRNSDAGTDAHEAIHFLVRGIIHSIFDMKHAERTSKWAGIHAPLTEFYNKATSVYNGAVKQFRDKLITIERQLTANKTLSQRDQDFMAVLQGYLNTRGLKSFTEGPLTADQVRELYVNTFDIKDTGRKTGELSYMFFNPDELFAETFSNPFSMGLMAMLPSNNNQTGHATSYFRSMIEGLTKLIKDLAKQMGMSFTAVKNNFLEDATQVMENMERMYLTKVEEPTQDRPIPLMGDMMRRAYELLRQLRANTSASQPNQRKSLETKKRNLLYRIALMNWKNPDITSQDDLQDILDKVNKQTKVGKLGSKEALVIWSRIEKYRKIRAEVRKAQANGKKIASTLPEYIHESQFKQDYDDFSNVDIEQLKPAEMVDYEYGFNALMMGGIPSNRAYNIVNRDVARKTVQAMQPFAGKYSQDPKLLGGLSIRSLANPATTSTIIAKYNKPAAHAFFKNLYGGLLHSKTLAQKKANAFTNGMFEIAAKHKMTPEDYNKVHMYGIALATRTPVNHPQHTQEIKENLDNLVQNANNKVVAKNNGIDVGIPKKMAQAELEIAKKLREDMLAGKTNILNRGQSELYEYVRTFLKTNEEAAERSAKGVWGNNSYTRYFNYMPTQAIGKVKNGQIGDDDLLHNRKTQNMYDATMAKPNLEAAGKKGNNWSSIQARQNGHTKERLDPKGYFYDYNILSIMSKMAPKMLFDIHGSRVVKSLNLALNGVKDNPVSVDGVHLYDIIPSSSLDVVKYQIRSVVDVAPYTDAEGYKAIQGVMKFKNNLQGALLATGGQFFTQISSALPAAAIMSPKGFPKALQVIAGVENGTANFGNVRDFLEKNGLSIQLRDVLFERYQTVEDLQKLGLERASANTKAWFRESANKMLRSGDKMAARLVWFSEFFASGGTLEKPTVDAVLAAERAVGVMQNMSDLSFAAAIFKGDTPQRRIMVQLFLAFKSFSLNAGINTYYSAKYFLSAGEARKVLLANAMMAASYHATYQLLIKPMYGGIANMVGSWFGIDGDDDDEDKDAQAKAEYILKNSAWDLAIGQISPAIIDQFLRYKLGQIQGMHKDALDEQTEDVIFKPKNINEVMAEGIGLYGDVIVTGDDFATQLYSSAAQALDLLEEKPEEAQRISYLKALQDIALLSPMVPFRGDVAKLLRYEIKKLEKEEKAAKKGTNSIEDLVEDYGTEFGSEETEQEDFSTETIE